MGKLILALNTGSTSTKIGLFNGYEEIIIESISHREDELAIFPRIINQEGFRLKFIRDFLDENEIRLRDLQAVVGRGGLLRPLSGGTYLVNNLMIKHLKDERVEEHASNLGGVLARNLADKAGCPAYIVDPVIVDELADVARITGLPGLEKRSIFHALNQKASAKKYAAEIGMSYDELNLIVAHLGGGISVGLHHNGQVIDVNNALSGEGPFSPNRSGGLPAFDLIKLCYSGRYTYEEMRKKLLNKGGLLAYLGMTDIREVICRIESGDQEARLIFKAMVYQVAKEIGSLVPILAGKIDAIILTGGIAHSMIFINKLSQMIAYIAPIRVYPGEEELNALAAGANRVLSGEEKAKEYFFENNRFTELIK